MSKHPLQYRELLRTIKRHNLQPSIGQYYLNGRACAVGVAGINLLGLDYMKKNQGHIGGRFGITGEALDRGVGVDLKKLEALEFGFHGYKSLFRSSPKKYLRYYKIGKRLRREWTTV